MSTFEFTTAIIDETVFLLDDAAKLTISAKNANDTIVINLNKVSTVIVFAEENADESSNTTIIAMHKMAAALKLATSDYGTINLKQHPEFKIKQIFANTGVQKLICLGVDLKDLGLHIESIYYKPFIFNNISIITSHSLTGILPEHKAMLWARLQQMYGLK